MWDGTPRPCQIWAGGVPLLLPLTNLPVVSLKGSCVPPSRDVLLLLVVASSSPG